MIKIIKRLEEVIHEIEYNKIYHGEGDWYAQENDKRVKIANKELEAEKKRIIKKLIGINKNDK